MSSLIKDRNILKRLVESYGKQDVVNFVNHLNESDLNDSQLEDLAFGMPEKEEFMKAFKDFVDEYNEFYEFYSDGKTPISKLSVETIGTCMRRMWLNCWAASYKSLENKFKNGENPFYNSYEKEVQNTEKIENRIRQLQDSITKDFYNSFGVPIDEFITDDYTPNKDGYVYLSPNSLWDDESDWMPNNNYILAPGLLINPNTNDIKFVIECSDKELNDQKFYEVSFKTSIDFAEAFADIFDYAKRTNEDVKKLIDDLARLYSVKPIVMTE